MTTADAMAEYMVVGFQLDNVVGERREFHYEDWTQCFTKTTKLMKLKGCGMLKLRGPLVMGATSLQSAVDTHHRLRQGGKEALHATVMEAWDEVKNEQAFKAVFDWLAKNYDIIRQNGGDNTLIEAHCGKAGNVALDSFVATAADHKEDDANASDV